MKYKSTIFLLTVITYAQAVNAESFKFNVYNNTGVTITIRATSSYCINSATQYLQIETRKLKVIDVDFKGSWGCGFTHSSQDFEVTFTKNSHHYHASFELYKGVAENPVYKKGSDPDNITTVDNSVVVVHIGKKP